MISFLPVMFLGIPLQRHTWFFTGGRKCVVREITQENYRMPKWAKRDWDSGQRMCDSKSCQGVGIITVKMLRLKPLCYQP